MVYKYQRRPVELFQRQAEQSGYDREGIFKPGIKVYRMRDGANTIRILPQTWSDMPEHYGYKLFVHFRVGPQRATVICPMHFNHKKCPICEAQQRAEHNGDQELARSLAPKKRYIMWVLDRTDEQSEALGPQIINLPYTLDSDIIGQSKDPRTGKLYWIEDPENGFEVYFNRVGKGGKTEYAEYRNVSIARESTPVDEQIIEQIVKTPVPDMLLHRTYDEIKALFEGGDSDEAEEPAKNPRFRGARRRSDPELEPDSQDVEGPPETASGDSDVEDEVPFEKYEGEQRQSREDNNTPSNVDVLRERFARKREQK